jgi:hypothetical protein
MRLQLLNKRPVRIVMPDKVGRELGEAYSRQRFVRWAKLKNVDVGSRRS